MSDLSSQSSQDTALINRIAALEFHIGNAEKGLEQLRALLANYVLTSENNLQLQLIKDSVQRIERDMAETKHQLTDLNSKLSAQEAESRQREAKQRESQDKLQIRVLWGIVSTIIFILSSILVGYITHIFH